MKWIAIVSAAALVAVTPAPAAEARSAMEAIPLDVMGVVPPATVIAGRVLKKDGVTPVARAEVLMTGAVDEEPRVARSDRAGHFRLRLPAGQYGLQITQHMEVYKARSVYRVPTGGRVDIDFLLLPDFEKSADPADDPDPPALTQGPDPVPDAPAEVGSVVDMMHSHTTRRLSHWSEALGFLGSILAVALAAN